VRLPWLAHDEAPKPYITIPQYRFDKTKQHTHKPTNPYISTLPPHSYTTPTTFTAQHTLHPTLHAGLTPAHLLNEHVVSQCTCVSTEIGYHVSRHLLAKVFNFNLWEPPEEGRGIELPPKTCNSGRLHNHYCFVEAGFRPRVHSFVWFVPLSRTKRASRLVARRAPGPSSQVLPGCRVWHLGSKNVLVWNGSIKSLLFFLHLPLLPLSLTLLLHLPLHKWGGRGGRGGREVGWWEEKSAWRQGTRRSVQAYVWLAVGKTNVL